MTEISAGRSRRCLVLSRQPPHGRILAWEALDLTLALAAFDHQVVLAFIDDGVWQLVAGQQPEVLGIKDFARGFRALGDYGIDTVYVERESLEARGLGEADLLIPVQVVEGPLLSRLLEQFELVIGG